MTTNRTFWRRRHGHALWRGVDAPDFSDQEWRKHFRMSRDTFEYIAEQLRPLLDKRTPNGQRRTIHYKKRLAIVLWWLATPTEYRSLATLFGIGISTLCNLTREVCHAIKETLLHQYISLPSGHRLQETIHGFERRGFPQCAGAIDGTHLPIIAPCDSPADYHNRKGWHSIILQAIVDHNYCFTDINIGWPGRTHDARVLANSDFYHRAENEGQLFPVQHNRMINGVEVPVVIIGDPAYPLKRWLMKAFPNTGHLTRNQQNFNFRLSSARMVVENAFGRLKGRWRRLLKRNDVDTAFASEVAAVCCVLHNICEVYREHYYPEWDVRREEERRLQQPVLNNPVRRQGHDAEARAIREAIMNDMVA
ncbi:uncharacterized protein [Diadema setosum]|uniref:uncharacterized protein n=1 Tax=Diadema setosum TaxID=31175 RepID=UPI003B3A781D